MTMARAGNKVPCRNILPYLLIALLLSHCSTENPGSGSRSHPILDTLDVELPEGIRELDNLTIFPIDQSPKARITLKEEVRFGNTEKLMLGHINPHHILIDSVGRIFVGDGGWGHRGIQVYAPDGSHIKTMAGEGKGPGEVMDVSDMGIVGNELYLFDDDLDRINMYSLDRLDISRTLNLKPQKWDHIEAIKSSYLSHIYFRDDGTYLAGFVDQINPELSEEKRLVRYYRMNDQAEIISEEIHEQRALTFIRSSSGARFTLDHARKPLLAHSDNNAFISARTEYFLLKHYDSTGAYRKAIFYPFRRNAIDRQRILSDTPSGIFRAHLEKSEFPELWPALHTMLRDDRGRMWVATVDNYQDSFTWWVLEESGEVLARLTLPQNERVAAVKDGYAYVLVEEGGSEEIVKYQVSFAPPTEPPKEIQ